MCLKGFRRKLHSTFDCFFLHFCFFTDITLNKKKDECD